jgi:hypothetical protein
MSDILIEIIRAIITGAIVSFLFFNPSSKKLRKIKGWPCFAKGFALLFLGTLFDLTDNFEILNRFLIIGDTVYQAVIEKVFCYMLGAVFIAIGFFSWIPNIIELQKKKEKELEEAKEKVKILSGFLPICASCKNIRDDEGFWSRIETYISEHSDAEFTHSICPDCVRKLYPQIADDLLKNSQ